MNRLSFALTLLCAAGSSAALSAQGDQPRVKVGETAPAFNLKDQSGKQASLKQLLAKKPVALVFYRSADW